MAVLASGCTRQPYLPRPLDPSQAERALAARRLDDPALRAWLEREGVRVVPWPRPRWSSDEIALAALRGHPELEVGMAELHEREAALVTAAERPNPEFAPTLEHHSDRSGGRTAWSVGGALDWVIEGAGRRDARIALAVADIVAARADLADSAWRVRSEVRQSVLALVAARRDRAALADALALLRELTERVDRRVAAGVASRPDALAQHVELRQTEVDHAAAAAAVAEARARVEAALALAPGQLDPDQLDEPGWAEPLPAAGLDPRALRRRALHARSDIRRGLAQYAVSEASLRAAIAAQYPDVRIGPGLLFDQSDTVWQFSAALLLPLLHDHSAAIAEATAHRLAEQKRFEALQTRVVTEVELALTHYQTALATAAAGQALLQAEAARAARVGRRLVLGDADRLDDLRARLQVVAARRALENLRAAAQFALAALEQAVQAPLAGSHGLTRALEADELSGDTP